VKELIIEARVPDTPLTIVWKRLADEDAVLLVMMVEVADEPPMFEVRILPEAESVLEAVRLVIVAFEIVVVASVVAPVTTRVPFETSDEVAVTLPPVTIPPVSVETTVVRAVSTDEKKLVAVALVRLRLAIVVVANVVSPVNVLSPAKVCVVVETTPRDVAPALGMLRV
jgi:hypothetical protein